MKSLTDLVIKLRKGEYIKAVDADEKSVKLFHNEVVHYDKLLIATGGIPSLGLVLRPYKKHIQRYYSLEDILVLKEKIPDIQKCIVSGDGLSSLDLICGLTNLGKQVTYIVKGTRADFALQESEHYDELHNFLEEKGIEIITEDQIVSIEKPDNHYRVETLKHNTLTTDIVFAWDHYKPNIAFLENTCIKKESGIFVNTRLETSVNDIYAAGDCVEIYNPCVNYYWINFGWPNALEQGTIAGKNMLGQNEEFKIHETTAFNLIGKSLKARWWK
jgi:NAD(P)H-nitrite reductase large subunit